MKITADAKAFALLQTLLLVVDSVHFEDDQVSVYFGENRHLAECGPSFAELAKGLAELHKEITDICAEEAKDSQDKVAKLVAARADT